MLSAVIVLPTERITVGGSFRIAHLLYSSSCGLSQNLSFVSVFIFFKIFWWNFKQIQRNKNKINLWLKKLQVSGSVSVMEVMAWLHTWWCSWQILRPLRSKPNYFPHSLAAHRAQHRCAAERLLDVLSNSWNSFSEIQIFRVFMDTLVYCQFFLIRKISKCCLQHSG